MRATALFAATALLSVPAHAQTSGWTFALSPYVWLPGVSTSVETDRGTVDVDTSASDAVADLDMAFMGAIEAHNGRWSLILDAIYSDISSTASTPFGALFDKAKVDTRLGAYTVYAGYRIVESERGLVDLLAGGRFFTLDVDLTLTEGLLPREKTSLGDNWADAVVGLRGRYDFTDAWFATAIVDAGGFGGGSDSSWQALGVVGYQIDPRWSAQGGWRYMAVEKRIGGIDVEADLSGPIVGVTYRF